MLKPRALKRGDRIAVVAPASPFNREDLENGVGELKRLGFEAVFDDRIFARRGYVAGEAALRAAALADAWKDDSVAGVMVARGGYGSVHTLPYLDPALPRRARKVFVGYSDLTSVLSFLAFHCGLACFHGPSVAGCLGRGEDGYDRDSFVRAITRNEPLGLLQSAGLEALKCGEAAGVIAGGTLTQIASSLGTPFAFDPPAGHVLVLDDVGERPYRIDRMLTQLALAGILRRASAVVFNELPGCDEPGGRPTARDTVADFLRDFPGPVLFGLRTGHASSRPLTVPLGVAGRVQATGEPAVFVEEGAVE